MSQDVKDFAAGFTTVTICILLVMASIALMATVAGEDPNAVERVCGPNFSKVEFTQKGDNTQIVCGK